MEQSIKILSKSSSGNPYTVTFYFEKENISAFCSCPAGEHKKLCKHILQMLDGNDSILYDSNQKLLLDKVILHLKNTSIPQFLIGLTDKETLLKEIQQDLKKAKKKLEKAILKK